MNNIFDEAIRMDEDEFAERYAAQMETMNEWERARRRREQSDRYKKSKAWEVLRKIHILMQNHFWENHAEEVEFLARFNAEFADDPTALQILDLFYRYVGISPDDLLDLPFK